jgi:penicillin G amidase
MRLFNLIFSVLCAFLFGIFLLFGFGPLPPPINFLHPYKGFWQNIELKQGKVASYRIELNELSAPVQVWLDDRRVPHIYAANEGDLFYVQGYMAASLRLWQMEFTARFAAGRLSEVFGKRTVFLDLEQRRKGLGFGAENSLAAFESDPQTLYILNRYTQGVNAYIERLAYSDLPFEFKLFDYSPEPWTNLKSALILTYMADLLTGQTNDIGYSRVAGTYGYGWLNEFYPDTPLVRGASVVPDFLLPRQQFRLDTPSVRNMFTNVSEAVDEDFPSEFPAVGSNNWAVSGKLTESGFPMLANDPHLPLNLPSIWLEMHLEAPNYASYGVSIPGTPCIIIGFNHRVAWGVTNGTQDVKDWYEVNFRDDKKEEYLYDGRWLPVNYREEWIQIKGKKPLSTRVKYTFFGPVSYEDTLIMNKRRSLAMRWTGHEGGNELKTFYLLNKSQHSSHVKEAMHSFVCPAQNFVFATAAGDIGLIQPGLFPLRWPGQGKTILSAELPANHWQEFVPDSWFPQSMNPERGFVASANQHPFEATHPLYYTGRFEHFRNRRLLQLLSASNTFSVSDMMNMQLDTYYPLAAEALPLFLQWIEERSDFNALEPSLLPAWLDSLKNWDFHYRGGSRIPTLFQTWFEKVKLLTFDEFSNRGMPMPQDALLLYLLQNTPEHAIFDRGSSAKRETARDLIWLSALNLLQRFPNTETADTWADAQATRIQHMARVDALGVSPPQSGGMQHVLNAVTPTHGPSWRMAVQLGDTVKAWANYPGGQSGNPGSKFYDNQVSDWANGMYYELLFLSEKDLMERIKSPVSINLIP